jgi:hypothetical protein
LGAFSSPFSDLRICFKPSCSSINPSSLALCPPCVRHCARL